MTWRDAGPQYERRVTASGEVPEGEGWEAYDRFGMIWRRRLKGIKKGYCGLAGTEPHG